MSLTLYYHPLASFCHKVQIALHELGTTFEARIIDLSKPTDRAELQALWPIGKFPVIRDHQRDRNVAESSAIIEYLDHFHGGGHRLIPADWQDAFDVRFWDRLFDEYVQAPMQAIVADRLGGGQGDVSGHRAMLNTAYQMINDRMDSREWVAGAGFSLADCAAAPALFFASTLEPFTDSRPHLSAYFERLVQRPSFRRVLDEARPYLAMYPFAEAVPSRFR